MAKLTKLSQAINSISENVAAGVKTVRALAPDKISWGSKTDDENENTIVVINSTKDLTQWVHSMSVSAAPNTVLLLQSYLQVLNYVSSPATTGMMVDNLIVCLYKSLELTTSEPESKLLRDSFASLLQGVVFIAEARMLYEISSNQNEAMNLVLNANNMLAQGVSSTAMLVTQSASNTKSKNTTIPVVNSIVDSKVLDKKHRLMSKTSADYIERLKQEHCVMLNNLFQTLDKYSEVIGPSIQIHGLLSRYANPLVEQYTQSQHEEIEGYISKFSMQWEGILNEMNVSLHQELGNANTRRRIQGLTSFLGSLVSKKKLPEINTYEEMNHIYEFLNERHSSLLKNMADIKKQMAGLQEELSSLGKLKIGMRNALNTELTKLGEQASQLGITIADIDEKIRMVENVVLPIKKRVEEYSKNLYSIVEKYSIC